MIKIRQLSIVVGGLLAGTFVVTSCNVTDLQPTSTLSKASFYQTREDATAAVISIYAGLTDFGNTLRFYHWGEARADQTSASSAWGQDQWVRAAKRQVIDINSPLTQWQPMYQAIQRANEALVNIEQMPVGAAFPQVDKDNLLGEAYTLRAWAYFNLVRTFGNVPLVTTPSDDANNDYFVKQAPEKEVLDQIEKDLAFATAKMSRNTGQRRRATQGAAKALATHVKLWRNDYKGAEELATDLIANGGYALQATTTYMDQFWTSGGTGEIIFSLGFDQNRPNPVVDKMSWKNGGYGITPAFVWTRKFRDRGETVRGLDRNFTDLGSDGAGLILKLQGNGKQANSANDHIVDAKQEPRDLPVFRLADIYLLRAEARNRLGNTAGAIEDLNVIRKRVSMPEYAEADLATTEKLEDAILEERDIELCFEGQRWYDLLRIARRGRPEVLYNQATALLSGREKDEAVKFLKDKAAQGSWFLPINQSELRNNKNLIQNEAYK